MEGFRQFHIMFQRLARILYGLEFLIALVAIYTMWSAVAGENLDYVAWYWKALIGPLTAGAAVGLTMAVASEGPARRWRMIAWALLLAVMAIGAGIATYYYYLDEPQDEPSQTVSPAARVVRPRRLWNVADAGPHGRGRVRRSRGLQGLPRGGVCSAGGVGTCAVAGEVERLAAR